MVELFFCYQIVVKRMQQAKIFLRGSAPHPGFGLVTVCPGPEPRVTAVGKVLAETCPLGKKCDLRPVSGCENAIREVPDRWILLFSKEVDSG